MKISKETFQTLKDKRKCNCSRSQCLKLYCECFAQGLSCENCNCENCKNNISHTLEREEAVRSILSKNPNAFNSKSVKGKRTVLKGCNCKRSNCLKNYCECYEAKVSCTGNCKCKGCKNKIYQVPKNHEPVLREKNTIGEIAKNTHTKVVTHQMAEISCGCMLMQLEHSIENRKPKVEQERIVLEEFSKCLEHILVSIARNRVLQQSDHIIINDCSEEDIAIIQDGVYNIDNDKISDDQYFEQENFDCEYISQISYNDQYVPSIMVYENEETTDYSNNIDQIAYCQTSENDQIVDTYPIIPNTSISLPSSNESTFTNNQFIETNKETPGYTSNFGYPVENNQCLYYGENFIEDNANCISEQGNIGTYMTINNTLNKDQYMEEVNQPPTAPLDLAILSDKYQCNNECVQQTSDLNQVNCDLYKSMQFTQYVYDDTNRQSYWSNISEGENAVANLLYQPTFDAVTGNVNESNQSLQYLQGTYSPMPMNDIENFSEAYQYPLAQTDNQISAHNQLTLKDQMTYLPSQHSAFDFLLHKDNGQTVINFDHNTNTTDHGSFHITSENNSNYTQV